MNLEEKSSSKRKINESPSLAKIRFDQLVQAMEETPSRKPAQKSELKKTVAEDPHDLFENYFINPKRGSIGYEIKSKLTRKKSGKRNKSKNIPNEVKSPEAAGRLTKCKQLYKECLKKIPAYVSSINIEEYFKSFTPIEEKKQEESGSEEKSKLEAKRINFSLLTPNDHVIKIPNNYRRQKAKKNDKKLN